jgi:hypothetical protein
MVEHTQIEKFNVVYMQKQGEKCPMIQNSTSLHYKSTEETRNRRNVIHHKIKGIYDKPTVNIILHGEELKPFLIKSGMRRVYIYEIEQ